MPEPWKANKNGVNGALTGRQQPVDWAQYAWSILAMQGQRIMKEGKALASAEENIAELTAQAEAFAARQLPVLKALQVA